MRISRFLELCLLTLLLWLIPASDAAASGISIDAGLTPPEGRWIIRAQVRSMSRQPPEGMNDSSMDLLRVPLVVVHGLSPAITIGLRQIFDSRTMTMNGIENNASGLGDLYLFGKYKVLRVNTRSYTIGIAPTVGVAPPTGAEDISSESWNLKAGLFISGRAGVWGMDFNLGYLFRGVAGVAEGNPDPGDEFGVDLAFSRQFPVGNSGQVAIAPVLELTWRDTGSYTSDGVDLPNTGESIFSLAPGLKYTVDDLIIEGLVRFPVVQDQVGLQFEAGPMALLGIRRMF